ncbi:hypothetical protein METBIDRAFT_214330 [Metschnikowia bicuspidata var. bicuspidata NRRL YB-4993]|uniref:Uncharacterized protein n=1 Tax=Metschnikowia bicuspidata var. bicuspidata NRRL YB-4993 TaxID=869754 RepID=A0A1A0H679_9ASCO|nr:hypothetical protein METBIDRAFT_214330 [Metschnikowia bicuspidata var. bicuspidata NRRL YB-4993]OBA19465.1 hypothetical protein METBIDRAFT_214330 [Metschnikowia bicuspidata var. bicuspidata NRRL YB-4993]
MSCRLAGMAASVLLWAGRAVVGSWRVGLAVVDIGDIGGKGLLGTLVRMAHSPPWVVGWSAGYLHTAGFNQSRLILAVHPRSAHSTQYAIAITAP